MPRCSYYHIEKSRMGISGRYHAYVKSVVKPLQIDDDSVPLDEVIPTNTEEVLEKLKEEVFILYTRMNKVKDEMCKPSCEGRFRGGSNLYGCPWQRTIDETKQGNKATTFPTQNLIKPILERNILLLYCQINTTQTELELSRKNFYAALKQLEECYGTKV